MPERRRRRGAPLSLVKFPLFVRLARYRAAIDYARKMLKSGDRSDVDNARRALDEAVEGSQGSEEPKPLNEGGDYDTGNISE